MSDPDFWKKARDLLVNANIIEKDSPVTRKDASVVDFAVALKDGYALCALANLIDAQAVPRFSRNPQLQVCVCVYVCVCVCVMVCV
jgi:hypothetical protein